MLETLNVDTETFQELFDKNKQYLQTLLPYIDVSRDSEPSITILEILTMLSDIENYNINRILPIHYQNYMALLGIVRKQGVSAKGHVCVYPKTNQKLLAGTTFIAKDDKQVKHFETTKSHLIVNNEILGCYLQVQNTFIPFFNHQPIALHDVKVQSVYILCTQPIDTTSTFYFMVSKNARNIGVLEDYSEATVEVEYYSHKGWKKCLAMIDTTNAFLHAGCITITPYFTSAMCELQGKKGYPIRIMISNATYEIAPVIDKIELNPLSLIQKKTVVYQREVIAHTPFIAFEHVLEKTGAVLVLNKKNKRYQEVIFVKEDEGLKIMNQDNLSSVFLIISYDSSLEHNKYIFDSAGISSQEILLDIPNINADTLQLLYKKNKQYYIFNNYHYDKQVLCLGNGKDFPILPKQTECLIISQLETTLYQAGNIRHNTLSCKNKDIQCTVSKDSYGSHAPETIKQMLERVKEKYNKQETILDTYGNIVKKTPYLPIQAVGIFTRKEFYHQENKEGILIIVEKTTKKEVTVLQRKWIYQQLKKQAYINTYFEIRSLQYIFVTITIQFVRQRKKSDKDIMQAISTYIEKPVMQEWCLRKQTVEVMLLQFEEVLQVKELTIVIQNQSIEEYLVPPDIRLQVASIEVNEGG